MRTIYALLRSPSSVLADGERTFIEREPIDFVLAKEQHGAYEAALVVLGATVETLPPLDDCPDCVFVEDTAVVLDEVAILGSMGVESRSQEIAAIRPTLERFRTVQSLPAEAMLEGGDIATVGRTILAGLSSRTNRAGVEALAAIVRPHGYQVIGVPVTGCLHLKTACTPLPDQRLLLNPRWLDTTALTGFRTIELPASDPWGGCQLSCLDHVLIDACHEATIDLLSREGYSVLPLDLSEFSKAEAGPTCLSLVFGETT